MKKNDILLCTTSCVMIVLTHTNNVPHEAKERHMDAAYARYVQRLINTITRQEKTLLKQESIIEKALIQIHDLKMKSKNSRGGVK